MKLLLRDVTEADLPVLFEFQREPRAVHMAAFPARERDAFMAHWHANILGAPHATAKAIVVAGEVVGHISSWNAEGLRFVGYWLGEVHWGRGIASAALAEFVARHELVRPLCAFVAVHNAGSRRVLEKCGFRPLGEVTTGEDGVAEQLMQLTESSETE